jgi:hypothetical protein
MAIKIVPLDPDTPAGKAATEALTEVVASLQVAVAERRRKAAREARKKTAAA